MSEELRQTMRVWEADLGEDGRRLTLDELVALEQMHACQQLTSVLAAVQVATRYLASLEGRIDRLEQYLCTVDPRYPGERAQPTAGPGRMLGEGRER